MRTVSKRATARHIHNSRDDRIEKRRALGFFAMTCPGGDNIIEADELYLNAVRLFPVDIVQIACLDMSEKWTAEDHYGHPTPADFKGFCKSTESRLRNENAETFIERTRRMELATERSREAAVDTLLEACLEPEPEGTHERYWHRRRVYWLEVFAGALRRPAGSMGPRMYNGSDTEFDHIYRREGVTNE